MALVADCKQHHESSEPFSAPVGDLSRDRPSHLAPPVPPHGARWPTTDDLRRPKGWISLASEPLLREQLQLSPATGRVRVACRCCYFVSTDPADFIGQVEKHPCFGKAQGKASSIVLAAAAAAEAAEAALDPSNHQNDPEPPASSEPSLQEGDEGKNSLDVGDIAPKARISSVTDPEVSLASLVVMGKCTHCDQMTKYGRVLRNGRFIPEDPWAEGYYLLDLHEEQMRPLSVSWKPLQIRGDENGWGGGIRPEYLLWKVRMAPHKLGEYARAALTNASLQKALFEDPHFFSFGHSQRLTKEVSESFASYLRVKQIIDDHLKLGADPERLRDELLIVDICSGKGFTPFVLTHLLPVPVPIVMLDNNRKMNLSHLLGLPNVRFELFDIIGNPYHTLVPSLAEFIDYLAARQWNPDHLRRPGESASPSLLPQMPRRRHRRKVIMLGTHLCGDLSLSFIRAFQASEAAEAMVLVPCCLSGHRRELKVQAYQKGVDSHLFWCQTLQAATADPACFPPEDAKFTSKYETKLFRRTMRPQASPAPDNSEEGKTPNLDPDSDPRQVEESTKGQQSPGAAASPFPSYSSSSSSSSEAEAQGVSSSAPEDSGSQGSHPPAHLSGHRWSCHLERDVLVPSTKNVVLTGLSLT